MIKYVEYLETDGSILGCNLGDTYLTGGTEETIYFDFMPLAGSVAGDGYLAYFEYMHSTSPYKAIAGINTVGGGNHDGSFEIKFKGNSQTYNGWSFGTKYECVFASSGFSRNGETFSWAQQVSAMTPIHNLTINCNNAGIRSPRARYYRLEIPNELNLRPALDDNDTPCFYDKVSNTYFYFTGGTPTAGQVLHTFEASPTSLSFNSAGGSLTTTVNAETGWTCTTIPTGFTLSTTAGTSGTTSITVTAPSYTGTTDKSETVVFTDDDGYTINLALKQKKSYSAYTFCNMVKDQGHSWVDTGIYPDSATTIEIYVRNDYEEGGSVTSQVLVGNEEMRLSKNGSDTINFNYGDGWNAYVLNPQSSATFVCSNTGFTMTDANGTVERAITMTSFAGTGSTIKIAGDVIGLSPAFASFGRCIIKKGGNVVGDFMPCTLGTEVGFYDNVNQLFKGNSGTSAWTAIDEYGMVMGQEPFESLYLGTEEVRIMFLGEKPIYAPYNAPFSGLQMTSASSIGWSGDTTSLSIKSSEDWTLSIPSGTSWLSASTMSGTSGTSTVTLTAIEDPSSSRTATITATTANYSATCLVTQNYFVTNFLFNYNAKQYDETTHSFPKMSGQTFNQDLVLNTAIVNASTDYVVFNGSQWTGVTFNSTNENIFNRGGSFGKDFTFIYKVKFSTPSAGNSQNVVSCRYPDAKYNYFIRYGYSYCGDPALQLTPSTQPAIVVTTVDSDGNGKRSIYGTQLSTSGVCNFGQNSQGLGFFSGYADKGSEIFQGDFYWMFMATRKLTDDEIRTVVEYNENFVVPPTPTGETGTLSINVLQEITDCTGEGDMGAKYTVSLSGASSGVAGFLYYGINQMDYDFEVEEGRDPDSIEFFLERATSGVTNEENYLMVDGGAGIEEDPYYVDIAYIKAYAIDSNDDIIESISAITENIHIEQEGEPCGCCLGSGVSEEWDEELQEYVEVECPCCGGSGIDAGGGEEEPEEEIYE